MQKDIKEYIIFHIDTGCDREVLINILLREQFSKNEIETNLEEMEKSEKITRGKKSNFIVVNEFMPNTAENLRNESKNEKGWEEQDEEWYNFLNNKEKFI